MDRVWQEIEVAELWTGDSVHGFGEITELNPDSDSGECGDPEHCPGGPEILTWRIKFKSEAEVVWPSERKVLAFS